jgi:hypothetical protein
VDGRAVTLTPADREKLLKFEQEVRAMMPEVRAIALEALEIAYSAWRTCCAHSTRTARPSAP